MILPTNQPENWIRKYADRVATLKKLSPQQFGRCRNAIKSAFGKIYRGVVLDVDGTIVDYTKGEVDPELATLIGDLLRHGVPVILMSGRGRGAMRMAANSIRQQSRMPLWYLRRLQCVTHNGTYLLYTNTSSPEKFLEQEMQLGRFHINFEKLKYRLLTICADLRTFSPYLTEEPESFRIHLPQPRGRTLLEQRLKKVANQGICVSESQYGSKIVFDITPLSKVDALRKVALRMGLHLADFVCIGDKGAPGGNDHGLLANKHAFSVDRYSENPVGCFPVLDHKLQLVTGTAATKILLENLKILPPLSLSSRGIRKRSEDLRAFEKLAQRRAQEIAADYAQIVSRRYRALESTGQRLGREHSWNFNETFDVHSGAIKIRDWDLPALASLKHTSRLFDFAGFQHKLPTTSWAMFTDTGIILRGPIYYHSLANLNQREVRHYPDYATEYLKFFQAAGPALTELESILMSPLVFKSVLAIYDHLRNFVCQSFYVAFVIFDFGREEHPLLRDGNALLEETISGFADALINADCAWRNVCAALRKSLLLTRKFSQKLSTHINASTTKAKLHAEAFKFRETDYFLQNYAAVEIAVRDLARHGLIGQKTLCAVGLAYGGLDLAALCKYVCKHAAIDCVSSIVKISMYSGSDENREKIYSGNQSYLREVVQSVPTPVFTGGSIEGNMDGRLCVLLDDNCTTCATLQLARDVLFFKNAHTIGAVVVRYPGINRYLHMAMKHHGFPEPENLFSFVRGLVAPAPYSRLVNPHPAFKYKDQLGTFDKYKKRIENYLKKRQTYPKVRRRR